MTLEMSNPRSTLHALEPYGIGTPEVESLTSYFCRLAESHSVETLVLARTIGEHLGFELATDYEWHKRQISGLRDAALTWSAALSALTSIPRLDQLTYLPWRCVISQNGLSITSRGKFCPDCFAEDYAAGRSPYFRLSWELSQVTVCDRHSARLCTLCPDCGRDKIRHSATIVIPGWCTNCGAFLGTRANQTATQASDEELWRAKEVGNLLRMQGTLTDTPSRCTFIQTLERIISGADNGHCAAFARRIGVAKSTVHHWLKGDGTPGLSLSLVISSRCGVPLANLLTGDLSSWRRDHCTRQLPLALENRVPRSRSKPRVLNWRQIDDELKKYLMLPTPFCISEIARQMKVETTQLYLRVNKTTRQLAARWRSYCEKRHIELIERARPHIAQACRDIRLEGKCTTRREILARIPAEFISSIPHLDAVVKAIEADLPMTSELIPAETPG